MHSPNRDWRKSIQWLIVLSLVCLFGQLSASACALAAGRQRLTRDPLDRHQQQHAENHARFVKTLDSLAATCAEKNLDEAVVTVRSFAVPVESDLTRIMVLPEAMQPEIPSTLPADDRFWRLKLQQARQSYAKDLYLLSQRAVRTGHFSYAYQLIREITHFDPDHKIARQLLGYVRQRREWVTPFSREMERRKRVWHDKFGWLPAAHVERYENGERQYRGRWISAEKDAALRRDFANAWQIRTEHYLVKTNHSLERGVEVAKLLETYHDFCVQMFAAFFHSPEQLQRLFNGRGKVLSRNKPYDVHYYRTQDEYNERLRTKIPLIEYTNGLYYTTDRTAYFFDKPDESTDHVLYHEATHQLFYESSPRDRKIAEKSHFWVVEGVSCYVESFRLQDGVYSLGDPDFDRFRAARFRLLNDGFYIPLERFASMGHGEFQSDSRNLAKRYSQAAGLSHFFMQYDGGRYRDAFIEYLSQLYRVSPTRNSRTKSLQTLTGVSHAELDGQYAEYLKQMERSVAGAQ